MAQAKEDAEWEKKFREWSWIDKKNPLLGEKSEVDWLLNALMEALERELRQSSRAYHSPEGSEGSDHSENNGVAGSGKEEAPESASARED